MENSPQISDHTSQDLPLPTNDSNLFTALTDSLLFQLSLLLAMYLLLPFQMHAASLTIEAEDRIVETITYEADLELLIATTITCNAE